VGEHPNCELVRRGFESFATGDRATIESLIHEDAVWHIPGRSDLAGEHRGREAILAMLRETATRTAGTYRATLDHVVADDQHVVAVYRASGRREGRSLDLYQVLIVRLGDARWLEVQAVPTDQYAFDEFWAG
jgi:ketosteroid isomerase-like protein